MSTPKIVTGMHSRIFLASYGLQLEFASLYSASWNTASWSTETIETLLRNCPDMNCHYYWKMEDNLEADRLRALGCRIRRMSITLILLPDLRPEDILESTRTCTMLESISYTSSPSAEFGCAAVRQW